MATANDVEQKQIDERKKQSEARRAKLKDLYERVRARVGKTRLDLEGKNPARAYYFGNIRPEEMATYNALGFVVNKDPSVKGVLPRQADGSLVIGDLILLDMPAEEYAAIQELNRLKTEDNLDAAIERLLEQAEREGFPIFEVKQGG